MLASLSAETAASLGVGSILVLLCQTALERGVGSVSGGLFGLGVSLEEGGRR
jgi:hypothetical protein